MSKSKTIIAVFAVFALTSTLALATHDGNASHSNSYSTQSVVDMAKNTTIKKDIVVGPLKLHSSTEAYMDIYNNNNFTVIITRKLLLTQRMINLKFC